MKYVKDEVRNGWFALSYMDSCLFSAEPLKGSDIIVDETFFEAAC